MITDALQYAEDHHDQFLAGLKELLAIPSISTLPEHKADIQQAAQWVADHLRALGMDKAQVNQTTGHPIVTAEWLKAGPDQPTVLIYGHYDVQPVDPINLWTSDPFQAEVRDDYLYGRGTSDDKGQLFIHFKVIESYLKSTGWLPVNVKVLVEGEEEMGGPSLDRFIQQHAEELKADVAAISDSHMLRPDLPTITYSLRGMTYLQIEVDGPSRDLHSGQFGARCTIRFRRWSRCWLR